MPAEVHRFTEIHVDAAAGLVEDHYSRLRALDPDLPPQWLDGAARSQDIRTATRAGEGVAATTGKQLMGFLIADLDLGGPIPESGWPSAASLGGVRSAMMRIGSHASSGAEPMLLYRSMYAALAADLVEKGCFRHSVAVALCDSAAVEAWFGLGFGIDQVLGRRDLAPLSNPRPDLAVRRAGPADVEALLRLSVEGLQHHAGPPTFAPLYIAPEPVRRDMIAAMGDPRRAIWVAEGGGELQGLMEITGIKRPSVNSARSETAITIGSAAVSASARSHGVGTAILARVIDWARSQGCDRCTVEWTSANTISDPFWRSRGFRPLQYVLTRHIDERVTAPTASVRQGLSV